MSCATRTEEYVGITELLDRFDGEYNYDEIVEVLRKYYPDPDDKDTGIDASLAENNPEFTIELDKNDERCDFYCVEHYIVKMPNREAADELANALGAEVIQVIGGVIVLYRESPELKEKAAQKEKNKKLAAKRAREKALRDRKDSKHVKVRVIKKR